MSKQPKKRSGKQFKVASVEQLADKFGKAASVVLADYQGLTVEEITDLRRQLRAEKVELKVVKNRLAKRAAVGAGFAGLEDLLKGTTALTFSYADPVLGPKILADYAKKNEKLQIKGGLLARERIDAAMVKRLAGLPSRQILLGRFLGSLKSSQTKLARGLKATVSKVAYALSAVAGKKGEGAPA
ncbi:MAG: 50S ribosomal protein L10 [bacterium]